MILVIGESGTGKTTSLENLNSEETFLIQSIGKPLPFRGWRRCYKPYSSDGKTGNMIVSDNSNVIVKTISEISANRSDIKNIVIDDFQYIMANEFMRRTKEKGYDKFNDIGSSAWSIINALNSARQDITSVVMSHSEQSETGKTKVKTLGKMLDDKVVIEGMFTIVLQSVVYDGQYLFLTQNNGQNTCKSPKGLFSSDSVPNDIDFVIKNYTEYQNSDLEQLKEDMLKELDDAKTEEELANTFRRYPEFKDNELIVAMFISKKEELNNDSSVQE